VEARAPRHKHVQLEGQFCLLVHILCVWQELQWSCVECNIFLASDSHISHHIYIYATAISIFNFITAQTYGHNFGPDALPRKQCRARVLAALGRALGVGPHGPVPPHPSDHAKSERTRSVLVLAAVRALQLRRSRRDSDASKCAGSAR
jgi:hypothetical protein